MKKCFSRIFLFIMAIPMFLPFMPHAATESFHAQHEQYHLNNLVENTHNHHYDHSKNHGSDQDLSHGFHIDIVTYFNNYLHVDLQNPDQVVSEISLSNKGNNAFSAVMIAEGQTFYAFASLKNHAPPDWQEVNSKNTPLYLSTQRLRI